MIKHPRWTSFALILAGVLACAATAPLAGCKDRSAPAAGSTAAGTEAAKDGAAVAVEVDGAKLTEGEIEEKIGRMFASRGGQSMSDESMREVRSKLREQMIELFVAQTLLVNEANREKIAIEDGEVEKVMADIRGQLPAGTTLEQMLNSYGLTEEKYRQNLRKDLQIRKLLDTHVKMAPEVTDAEIEGFYSREQSRFSVPEQVRARHILVKCGRGDGEAGRAEKKAAAEECRKKLIGGADFAALAREISDCPSKENGGDIGAFRRDSAIAVEFKDAAFAQATNEIGRVVETEFGYHVIQVTEHSCARTNALAEVKEMIVAQLGDQKRKSIVGEYVRQLKSKAKIKHAEESQKPG